MGTGENAARNQGLLKREKTVKAALHHAGSVTRLLVSTAFLIGGYAFAQDAGVAPPQPAPAVAVAPAAPVKPVQPPAHDSDSNTSPKVSLYYEDAKGVDFSDSYVLCFEYKPKLNADGSVEFDKNKREIDLLQVPDSTELVSDSTKLPASYRCAKPYSNSADPIRAGQRLAVVVIGAPVSKCSALDSENNGAIKTVLPAPGSSVRPSGAQPGDVSVLGVSAAIPEKKSLDTALDAEKANSQREKRHVRPAPKRDCYAVYPGTIQGDSQLTVEVAGSYKSKIPLPAAHNFYKFGVSTGVVVSSVVNRSYGYAPGSTAAAPKYVNTGTTPIVEPVLFVTWYPKPLDPEAKARWSDVGVIAGLSEKAPSTNFYLGLSSEPIRYVAIVAGANVAQVGRLDSSTEDPGQSASHITPGTVNRYRFGAFLGVTIGFSNFLQTAFK